MNIFWKSFQFLPGSLVCSGNFLVLGKMKKADLTPCQLFFCWDKIRFSVQNMQMGGEKRIWQGAKHLKIICVKILIVTKSKMSLWVWANYLQKNTCIVGKIFKEKNIFEWTYFWTHLSVCDFYAPLQPPERANKWRWILFSRPSGLKENQFLLEGKLDFVRKFFWKGET